MPATPVVFIPALMCDEAMYREVIDGLGDSIAARVVTATRPAMAENVVDVLANAPERFVLAGTSFGGNVALEVALAAPERVSALWLMGCSPAAANPEVAQLVAGLEADPDAVVSMLAAAAVNDDASAEVVKEMAGRVGPGRAADQGRALASRAEVTSRLSELRMPVLVVWGAEDRIVPASAGRALADALPHAHFHHLADCGHLPTLEQPHECAELLAEFLEDEAGHDH